MFWLRSLAFWAGVLVCLASTSQSQAVEGGYSNYIPGLYGDFGVALTPEPGLALRNDFYYYNADTSRTILRGRVETDLELSFGAEQLTLFYATNLKVLGGRYAFGAGLPLVFVDVDTNATVGGQTQSTSDDRISLGDMFLIPLSLYWNLGNVYLSFAEFVVVPIGAYDKDRAANAGLNYWSFDTNLAFTYLHPTIGTEFSFNIGHIFNTENPDTDYQSGQEFHLDYMINQFFSETFAIGVQGFYYHQITGDSGDGAVLGDLKGEAAGIGPAVLWAPKIGGKTVNLIAKWLHDFHAERRLEGDIVFFSVALQL